MTGYPEVGKTTLAREHNDGRFLIHLDDIMKEVGFLETPREALKRVAGIDAYLIEGTQGFRLLRFALRNKLFTPPRVPLDCVVLVRSRVLPKKKHLSFIKGCDTIWRQTYPLLRDIAVWEIGSF